MVLDFHTPPNVDEREMRPRGDHFFLLVAAWIRSRAERPSVSYTKVTAKSQGQAISCKYTTRTFKQISGSNKEAYEVAKLVLKLSLEIDSLT